MRLFSFPRPAFSRSRRLACSALFLAGVATASAAPRIDSVGRTAQCDGQGVDYSPFIEDDQALSNSTNTLLAGTFTGHVALPIALNGNIALYTADHVSTVNPADLTFSAQGVERIDQDATFDASDVTNRAFHQGSSSSAFTLFFTLANTGKVTLSVSMAASHSYSVGLSPAAVGNAFTQIQICRGTTVIWSRYVADGTLGFTGDVVLPSSGQYQLTINSGANLSLNASTTGARFTEATSSYGISGRITENNAGNATGGSRDTWDVQQMILKRLKMKVAETPSGKRAICKTQIRRGSDQPSMRQWSNGERGDEADCDEDV